jgi:hypothetical protein
VAHDQQSQQKGEKDDTKPKNPPGVARGKAGSTESPTPRNRNIPRMVNISFFIIDQGEAGATAAANLVIGYIHGPTPKALHIIVSAMF